MDKWKVIVVVVGLLLTGFVAGFMTNRYLIRTHIHQFRQADNEHAFGAYLIDRLDASPEQLEQLKPVMDYYGKRFHQLGQEHRAERTLLTDSLYQQINPLLTPEQQKASKSWRRILDRGPRSKKGKK